MSTSERATNIQDRFKVLEIFDAIWASSCKILHDPNVIIGYRSSESLRKHSYYGRLKNTKFYTWKDGVPDVPLIDGATNEEQIEIQAQLRKGILMLNTCQFSCATFYPIIQAIFTGDGEVAKVEWVHVPPYPKFVFLPAQDSNNRQREIYYDHDVILLTLKSGHGEILDYSGAQFGFLDRMYPLDEYLAKNVNPYIEGPKIQSRKSTFAKYALSVSTEGREGKPELVFFIQTFTVDLFIYIGDK